MKEVHRELGYALDSDICEHVATLRMARQNLLARISAGQHVPTDDLLKIDAALKSHQPQAKAPTIKVNIVEGVQGVCPLCKGLILRSEVKGGKCPHCKAALPDYRADPPRTKPAPVPDLVEPVVVKPAPAPPAGPPRRPQPVVADRLSPLSFSRDFDPPRNADNPFSPFAWPSPNRKVEG
jgi:hypothetical protein